MKPLLHAKISAKRFGGQPEDYIEIHNWIDQVKAHVPDARHRLILHNSFGIFLCEQMFGEIVEHKGNYIRMPYVVISGGRQVSVRDIAEQHVIDDLGHIPTLVQVLDKAQIPASVISGKKLRNYVVVD